METPNKQSKDQKNPYHNIRKEWNALFNQPIQEKHNWQIAACFELLIIFVLAIGLIATGLRREIVPWIVEVDQTGRAVASGPAQKTEMADDKIIRAYLYDFIEMARSIISDPEAMRKNFDDVYRLAAPPVRNFLNEYYQENNPFDMARKKSVQVKPLTFLKQTENTYIVEWEETERDMNNTEIERCRWKGLFIVTQIPPDSPKTLRDNPANPFGIFIKSISWSKTL